MDHNLFNQSPDDAHLRRFQSFTTRNHAATNSFGHISFEFLPLWFWGRFLKMELQGQRVVACVILLGNTKFPSVGVGLFCIPASDTRAHKEQTLVSQFSLLQVKTEVQVHRITCPGHTAIR